jgi:hypothetical protein
VNAEIILQYANGEIQTVPLIHPDNFRSLEAGPGTERPEDRNCYGRQDIRRVQIGWRNQAADQPGQDNGIYAQLLEMPLLDQALQSLVIRAVANDIIIGLMGVTIV